MPAHPASNIESHFSRLTALLAEWQAVWRPLPFTQRRTTWCDRYPQLTETLLGLSDAQLAPLQADPWHDSPLADWLPVAELAGLVELAPLAIKGEPLPAAWSEHVGGRKWQQIEAFVQHLDVAPGERLLEWCAGKGHLSRALARQHEQEVSSLEWQASLCEEGRRLAAAQQAAVRLYRQDVLADEVADFLSADTHVVALHACGDLHLGLLERVVASGCAVTLAPCCYHRTQAADYRPVSQLGQTLCHSHSLHLERADLALAVQETVTAPQGVRRHRERANAWRLGFDELQRELRGVDTYLPVPSLAYGQMPGSFDAFCHWAAQRKGLALEGGLDYRRYESAGWQRLAEVSRLELVRHLFRRPLETWLALDRVRRLEEAGFRVEIGTFCAHRLTPRNLCIRARTS
ncbi:methyltransferase [Billgrantia ethanolica]|uniref:Methyltransferase n=1 Tax=Billgrantia ethanolica TaxID=2733486 RepID=A0ABS8ZY73_9GAMM|nr:methyltransferase [Halomonas ethanolica]MCE8001580.1 methyltransferase [Halomonas ethanolica]